MELTGPGHGRETAVLLLPHEVRLQLVGLRDREGGSFSPPEMKAQNTPEARPREVSPKRYSKVPSRRRLVPQLCAPGWEVENTNRAQKLRQLGRQVSLQQLHTQGGSHRGLLGFHGRGAPESIWLAIMRSQKSVPWE